MSGDRLKSFVESRLGHRPDDLSLFERAVSHSSAGSDSYQRLEFLGDRVLGIIIAHWLFERFDEEPEGKLSRRYNALVARESCGEVGRRIGVPDLIRLGKQARGDGASDNIIGDVVEALIGALFLDGGLEAAEAFVRKAWAPLLDSQDKAPTHPKSALQEAAAARNLPGPEYSLIERTGAHHSPSFRVKVEIRGIGEAIAEGATKQEAQTRAAEQLLESLK